VAAAQGGQDSRPSRGAPGRTAASSARTRSRGRDHGGVIGACLHHGSRHAQSHPYGLRRTGAGVGSIVAPPIRSLANSACHSELVLRTVPLIYIWKARDVFYAVSKFFEVFEDTFFFP
jgi:hypothetical protein